MNQAVSLNEMADLDVTQSKPLCRMCFSHGIDFLILVHLPLCSYHLQHLYTVYIFWVTSACFLRISVTKECYQIGFLESSLRSFFFSYII